ncbi:MAG: O-antigen ligase family protein [Bacteroidales bacterium]
MKSILKIKYSEWHSYIALLVVVVLFAFDLRTFLGGLLPISLVTSGILFILCYCFYSLFLSSRQAALTKVRDFDVLICVFIIMYGLRMCYNIYLEQIDQFLFNNRITCIVYYLFLCIFPYAICRRVPWAKMNMCKLLWILFVLFLLGLLASYQAILNTFASGDRFAGGRADANALLDTIGYGHTALSFIFICCSLFTFYTSKWRWFLIFPILFGFLSMGMANSRSPFVALFAIIGLIFLLRINLKFLVAGAVGLTLIIFNVDAIDLFFKEYFNSGFVERIITMFELGMKASSGRDSLYADGIQLFLDNPIFGRAIILISGEAKGIYVHNAIIEVFMGLGLVGGVLFLLILLKAFMYAIYLFRNKNQYRFFALIFIQYLIFLQFSRTLIYLPLFWASLACVYSCYLLKKNEKNEKNSNCYS